MRHSRVAENNLLSVSLGALDEQLEEGPDLPVAWAGSTARLVRLMLPVFAPILLVVMWG